MAYPPFSDIEYSYTAFQQAQGDNSFPGPQMDVDLAGLAEKLDGLNTFVRGVTRADGAVGNRTIGHDQLKPELSLGLPPPVVWATATEIPAGATTFYGLGFYRATAAHTSSSFAADLDAGLWEVLLDFSTSIETELPALVEPIVEDMVPGITEDVLAQVPALVNVQPAGGADLDKADTTLAARLGWFFEVRDYADYTLEDETAASDNATVLQAHVDWVLEETSERREMFLPEGRTYTDTPLEIMTDRHTAERSFKLTGRGPLPRHSHNNGAAEHEGGAGLVYTGGVLSGVTDGLLKIGSATHFAGRVEVSNLALYCEKNISGICAIGTYLGHFDRLFINRPLVGARFTGAYSTQFLNSEIQAAETGFMDLIENCHSFTLANIAFNGAPFGVEEPSFGVRIASTGNCSSVLMSGCNLDLQRCSGRVLQILNSCRGFTYIGGYIEGRSTQNGAVPLITFSAGNGIVFLPGRITADAATTTDYLVVVTNAVEGFFAAGGELDGAVISPYQIGSGAKRVEISSAVTTDSPAVVTYAGRVRNIASGVITLDTSPEIRLNGEGATTDDLVTINGGVDGQVITLRTNVSVAYTITVKDGTGNLSLGADRLLTGFAKILRLQYNATLDTWYEISWADN